MFRAGFGGVAQPLELGAALNVFNRLNELNVLNDASALNSHEPVTPAR